MKSRPIASGRMSTRKSLVVESGKSAIVPAWILWRDIGQIRFLCDRLQQSKEPGTLADAVAAILSCDIDVVSRLQTIRALMKTDQQAV
ncbi:MAG TPA: hypothetical protein VK148_17840 [Xanthobacteraceae bacterium]|nr:hypothetical protein [Xanthobacteraceae bacterium]